MSASENWAHKRKILDMLRRRLHILEKHAALQGYNTPPEVLLEIEDIRQNVKELARELEDFPQELAIPQIEDRDSVERQAKPYRPPEFAEYALWYLPKKYREEAMGDLAEEFCLLYKRFGRRKAVTWYYWQVAASFWPIISSELRKIVRLSVAGWVDGILRR